MSTATEAKKAAGPTLRTVSELLGLLKIMQKDPLKKQLAQQLQDQRTGFMVCSRTAKRLSALPRQAPLVEVTDQLPYNTVVAGVRIYWLPGGGEALGGRSTLTSFEEVFRLGGEVVPQQTGDVTEYTDANHTWRSNVHLLGTAFPKGTKLSPIEMAKDLYFLVNMEKGKPYLAGWYPGHTPLRKFGRTKPHALGKLLLSLHCRSEVQIDPAYLLDVPAPEPETDAERQEAEATFAEGSAEAEATTMQPLPIPPAPPRDDDWDDDDDY